MIINDTYRVISEPYHDFPIVNYGPRVINYAPRVINYAPREHSKHRCHSWRASYDDHNMIIVQANCFMTAATKPKNRSQTGLNVAIQYLVL